MPLELAEDRMHDTFLIVLNAIRDGRIEDANAFPGYVMTVTKRQYFHVLRNNARSTESAGDFMMDGLPAKSIHNPDYMLEAKERSRLMADVLQSMATNHREILHRFYVLEQPAEQICTEMQLTETQFRLLKSKAKAEFGALGRKRLRPKDPTSTASISRRSVIGNGTNSAVA